MTLNPAYFHQLCFAAPASLSWSNTSLTSTNVKRCIEARWRIHHQAATAVTTPTTVMNLTPNKTASPPPPPSPSRRAFTLSLLAASIGVMGGSVDSALADAISSQLTAYRDLPKGFTILRPNGWNEFEGLQDNYDIKWQDVIQPLEFITVLTNPVAKDKTLADLGTPTDVGTRLASSRGADLVSVDEKSIDGVPAYLIEMKREQAHQLTLLCVTKMKLYSVNASASERRWSKREKLLRAVVASFKPKL